MVKFFFANCPNSFSSLEWSIFVLTGVKLNNYFVCRSPPTIIVTEATPEFLPDQRDVDYFDQSFGNLERYDLDVETPPDNRFEAVGYISPNAQPPQIPQQQQGQYMDEAAALGS